MKGSEQLRQSGETMQWFSQCVVPGPAILASIESLLETQILRATKSRALGAGWAVCVLANPTGNSGAH